jgi:hypothetical protein
MAAAFVLAMIFFLAIAALILSLAITSRRTRRMASAPPIEGGEHDRVVMHWEAPDSRRP